MLPKTILFSDIGFVGTIFVSDVALSGSLSTGVNLAGSITNNVVVSGPLTTGIALVGTININVGLSGPLFTAKVGRALSTCGHPMFTKCERTHLGEE